MNQKGTSALVAVILTALVTSGCSDDNEDNYYRNQVLQNHPQQSQQNQGQIAGYTEDGRPIIINQQPQNNNSGFTDMATGMAIGAGAAMLYNNYQNDKDRDYDRRGGNYVPPANYGTNTNTAATAGAAAVNSNPIRATNSDPAVTPSTTTPKSSAVTGSSPITSSRTGTVISRGSSFGSGSLGA